MLDSLYKMLAAVCSMSGKVFKLRLSCICFINWGTHPFSEDVPVNKKSEIAEDLAGTLSGLGVDEGSFCFWPGIFLGATFFDEILPFPVKGIPLQLLVG